ncbi:universal stress protein [Mycolicibacterium stellerae]|uniref:universal stress protein n=1 Tax=Mycolicibacterium stellerae TaxID=2358193 RepID=UPI000F0B4BA0|nr:universal stress protein [Mycolicibacterium stellerae]
MSSTANVAPVIVGIDGSKAAIDAALWAVDEALDRDVPLRLVHVIGGSRPASASGESNDLDVEYGETSLRAASSAVIASGRPVKVETDLLWGSVDDTLISESESASMLCVGSVGIGWIAERILGSTAAAVSEGAHCPVVVVRSHSGAPSGKSDGWIVVGVDDRPANDQLVTRALDEGRVRHAPVLAVATWSSALTGVSFDELDHHVETWRQRYPDVHIRPAATGGGLPEFLVGCRKDVQLAVVSAADAGKVPQIIGPHGKPLVPYGECSVMVVH